MKINNILKITLGLVALTSCSSVNNKEENKQAFGKKAEVVVLKKENDNLENYTTEYTSENFDIRGDYVYKGEQLDGDYIDSETIIYRTRVFYDSKTYKETDKEYGEYPNLSDDKYSITIGKVANPKYDGTNANVPKMINSKTVVDLTKKYVYVTLKSLDTGEEKTIKIDKPIKELDPVKDVFNKYYPDIARYKDLKKNLDNNRIELSVVNGYNKKEEGVSLLEILPKETNFNKYLDLDDMVGEKEVLVRVRVNGIASERDQFVKKTVSFGEKLEDYSNNYEELLTDLNKTSLKFSADGKSILGGFDEYKTSRLQFRTDDSKAKNFEDELVFNTRILDEDPSKPTVGKHRVAREIIKNGNVIYSKEDNVFVDFNGPTVAIADNSFFDITPEIEKRTYRQSPYYTDPKFKFVDEKLKGPDRKYASLEKTHGATVIGTMIDELSYHADTWWVANQMHAIGNEGNKVNASNKVSDEKLKELLEAALNKLVSDNPDKTEFLVIKEEIVKKMNKLLKPAIEGKVKEFGKPEKQLTDEEKAKYLKEYYDFVVSQALKVKNIKESDKIPYTDINFSVLAIGQADGRGVSGGKVGQYLPKILDENKNIKLINMSYGGDLNYDDYIQLDNMSDEQKQKAADFYNSNSLYRFLIQSWLKVEKEKGVEFVSKGRSETFDTLELYDYFKNKKEITKEDFDKLVRYKMVLTEASIKNAKEFSAANHDILMVRAMGNTYNSGRVDLTNFKANGEKILIQSPDLKFNNDFASVPSIINYLGAKDARENGQDYKYDYSYRKNMINVVGLASKMSVYGTNSTNNFLGYGVGSAAIPALKNKNLTTGMYDNYISLVKELNEIRKNPDKYPVEYRREIEDQIMYIEAYASRNGHKGNVFSLTRAGSSKLWAMAAPGEYIYVTDVDNQGNKIEDDYKYRINFGSSFAAPRVTAVGSLVQKIFPWMSAHQIKQTLLTTAKDDYIEASNGLATGIYGVDENIGWGILDKNSAVKGPARFVKALTHEVGEENFIANVTSGTSVFGNNIAGAFDITRYMVSRGQFTKEEVDQINKAANEDEARKLFQEKVNSFIEKLSFEERELFRDAGLTKKGKGTLILDGDNTYTGDTKVEDGTLIVRGGMKSNITVEKGAKLKLDINNEYVTHSLKKDQKGILANIVNYGELYSYSDNDIVAGKYTPIMGSKTYVSPISLLSIASIDLSRTDNFTLDVFKSRGIHNTLSKLSFGKKEIKVFEAKANQDEVLTRVKLGVYPISELLSFSLEYKDKTLTGKIILGGLEKPAEDKRPGNDRPPFVNEIEEKLKEIRDKLNKEAEKRAEEIAKKEKENENKPKPTSSRYRLDKVEEALDTILYATFKDTRVIDGETLADSLTAGYTVSSLKLNENNKLLNEKLVDKKFSLFTNLVNEFNVSRDSINRLDINSRVNGVNINLGYKLGDYNFFLGGEFLNGNHTQDDIVSTKFNSLGVSGIIKYVKDNYEFDATIATNTLFKKVYKDYLYESKKEHDQNQFTVSEHLNFGYKFNPLSNLEVKPYVGMDIYTFVFNKYDSEDSLLGIKYDTQSSTKVAARFGLDSKFTISNKFDLGLNTVYTKWLTDPTIKLKVKSSSFEDIKNEVSSVKLPDNEFRTNVYLNYTPTDKLSIKFGYGNKNLTTQNLNLGIKYTF